MRHAFIDTLIKQATKNKRIILLTGDVGFTVLEDFRDKFPTRFFNVGVAEQNMIGVATGLALTGKIVFVYTIATFASMRAFEHIRNDVGLHQLPVTIVGSGAGLCYGHASVTHHAQEDISLMRVVPGMTVLCPADPFEVAWATRTAIRLKKPVYLRLGKKGESVLGKKTPQPRFGKGRSLQIGKDVAIIATGNIAESALQAAQILSQKNITASVVSLHTLKPLDADLVKKLSHRFPLLVTVEEHTTVGGLGSAVAEVLAGEGRNTVLLSLGIPDRFVTEIGSHEFLRERVGLAPKQIAERIWNSL